MKETILNLLGFNKEKNYDKNNEVCSNVQTKQLDENEHGEHQLSDVTVQPVSRKTPTEKVSAPQYAVQVRQSPETYNSPFIIKTANQWSKETAEKPIPKMILGELWFENEICILFANTNVGKSSLAVQIADSITKGQMIEPFQLEIDKKRVLYFDFENSVQCFTKRYSEQADGGYKNRYEFDENFLRVERNRNIDFSIDPRGYEESLITDIATAITESGVEIIIIDNLSWLKSDNENAKDAAPFMQQLVSLKEKYQVSILVVGHTPKIDPSKPLDVNDLAGSKMLSNYADSIFAIGQSQADGGLRYIKQIKVRNSEKVYDLENVCLFEHVKTENFLKFEFRGHGNELDHLATPTRKSRDALRIEAVNLSKQGKTQREIADILNISLGKVNGLLKEPAQMYDMDDKTLLNENDDIHVKE